MQIIKVDDLKQVVINEQASVTIGSFDFVHLGHQSLINTMDLNAKTNQRVVITFDTHPLKEISIPISGKLKLLQELNIDTIIILTMHAVVNTSADEFVEFLKINNIVEIYLGPDFYFGNNKSGDKDLLKQHFKVTVIDFLMQGSEKIGSRDLRKYVTSGDLMSLKALTNRNYTVYGTVVKGRQIGRTIGFNTANVQTEYQLLKNGVYLTYAHIDNKRLLSISNIGVRPTVNGVDVVLETHILDFDQDIYGANIGVEFIEFIRGETKFESLEELKVAIDLDLKYAQNFKLC